MARNNLFHNSIAHHAEVGQVTGCPEEDHLQALKDQHHLDRGRIGLDPLTGPKIALLTVSVTLTVKDTYLSLYVLFSL